VRAEHTVVGQAAETKALPSHRRQPESTYQLLRAEVAQVLVSGLQRIAQEQEGEGESAGKGEGQGRHGILYAESHH